MSSTTGAARRARWAACAVICVVLAGAAPFVFALDRHPAFSLDEAAFAIPAVRALEGEAAPGWVFHTQAPHASELLRFHGPFFPAMQKAVLEVTGASHFWCRFPAFLAGMLATVLLGLWAIRQRSYLAALLLAAGFALDRWSREIAFGRPDAPALLLLALALVLFHGHLRNGRLLPATVAGACLGLAIGFNPTVLPFALVAAVVAPAVRGRRGVASIGALAIGGGVAGVLALALWWPDLGASFEQLHWHATLHELPLGAKLWERMLGRGHPTAWAMLWSFAVCAFLVLPRVLVALPHARAQRAERAATLPLTTGAWALAGCATVLLSSGFAYYTVFLAPFALLAAGVLLSGSGHDGHAAPRRWPRALWIGTLALVLLASGGWRALRAREALLAQAGAREHFARVVAGHVPAGAPIFGDSMFFIELHASGRRYRLLPHVETDLGTEIPAGAYLVLAREEGAAAARFAAHARGRERLFAGELAGLVGGASVEIYGPRR